MGLTAAREALTSALVRGDFQHEARATIAGKNLLAIGEISADEVIAMLLRTRGDQYSSAPHDCDARTTVYVFRPVMAGVRWYVKAYLLDEADGGTAVFIGVHG